MDRWALGLGRIIFGTQFHACARMEHRWTHSSWQDVDRMDARQTETNVLQKKEKVNYL